MPDDDPYVPFIFHIRQSKKQRIKTAAAARGVSASTIGRWVFDLKEADRLLRSLTTPTNGARDDADHPGG